MNIKKTSLFCILILFVNLFALDFIYYTQIDKSVNSFDPIIGNKDYARHHAISRQIYENKGFYSIFDSTLNELPYLYAQPFPTIMYSLLIKISNDNHLFTFFSSLAIFSLLYLFSLKEFCNIFFKEKSQSFIIATTTIITGNIIFLFPYLLYTNVLQIDSILIIHRIINPLFSYFLLILALITSYKIFSTKELKYHAYFALYFSCLLLSYIYFWSYILVAYVIIMAYQLLENKQDLITEIILKIKQGLLFVILSLPVLGIFIYNSFLQSKISFYEEYLFRNNVIKTHNLIISTHEIFYLFFIPIFVLMCYIIKKNNFLETKKLNFLIILISTSFILTFNNVLSGLAIQRGHWFAFITFPLFLITALITFTNLYPRIKIISPRININTTLSFILITVTIFNLFFITLIGVNDYQKYQITSDENKVLDYLNNLNSTITILTTEQFSRIIVASTHHDTLFADIIEKLPNHEQENRKNAYDSIIKNCSIQTTKKFDIIITNKTINCENLKLKQKFQNLNIYSE